ncbi:hypothetical protein [Mangrovibacterium diazotrophicum]|uniref:Uncharacterized protein n=1 Tax=Mangrovibacterium diazotrophicum TaxID=1261403 RepID=A0A419VW63_9BACT|nr:hypothetical protein [Mangrovibacterium diazotrophicum]RKD86409.1 hypothetical protein BC643_4100 [Mangrovibacterium diazotrophicum]
MRTILNLDIPKLENKAISEKLQQLTREFQIAYIFYHQESELTPEHLIIVTSELKDVQTIRSRKWIRNSRENSNCLFHVIFRGKMEFEYKMGNPFIASCCHRSGVIYRSQLIEECPNADWSSYKKKFKRNQESYYHDRDTLLAEANGFGRHDSLTGVFLTYLSIFLHAVRHLEMLYIGCNFEKVNLHERIKQLTGYIPEIEGLFVKKNGREYYLVSELERAKETGENGDETRLNENLQESIIETELKMNELVAVRFAALKKKIKAFGKVKTDNKESCASPIEQELSEIVVTIRKTKEVEEIYFFDRLDSYRRTTYFILLIGEGLGTENLGRLQQTATAKLGDKFDLVLIGHSRIWIQTNLFAYQSFFREIMRPENLLFSSHSNLLHWEHRHTPEYPDLEYYYSSAAKMTSQYFTLRKNSAQDNMEGLEDLFGKSMLRIFRTFVFARLSYLPNYLSAGSLWKLCLYAEPRLEKMEFLFEKLGGDRFFQILAHINRFHHDISRMTEEKLELMDEILMILNLELKSVCQRKAIG